MHPLHVVHAVTWVSADNAFGGPSRVALLQVDALHARGVHAELLAAAPGRHRGGSRLRVGDVDVRVASAVRLLPGAGFTGMFSPRLALVLLRAARRADVVHLHLARDLVMLPIAVVALATRKPLVVQPHGMVTPKTGPLARLTDVVVRAVLRRAAVVLCLNPGEAAGLREVAGPEVRAEVLPNGVRLRALGDRPALPEKVPPEVLFAARLHERKRPRDFVEAAAALAGEFPEATFALVGPDEGEAAAVQRLIADHRLGDRIAWCGPATPAEVAARMARCAVYVLPSRDEPFGMTLIEAMAEGTPVVLCRSGALADAVEQAEAGIVTDDTVPGLRSAIATLLASPELRTRLGANGRRLVEQRFDVDSVAGVLVDRYRAAAGPALVGERA